MSLAEDTTKRKPFIAGDAQVDPTRRPRRHKCNCHLGMVSCPARRVIDLQLVPLKESKRNKKWRLLRKGRAPDLRERLIHAFDARCQYCGEYGDDEGVPLRRANGSVYHVYRWTIDRIDPIGTYDPDNVTLACNSCNGRKGNRLPYWPVPSLAEMEGRHV